MKAFHSAKALFAFLGALCATASAYPGAGLGSPDVSNDSGYRALTDMSPFWRGLLGSTDIESRSLEKRQCGPGDLYCPATNFCCIPGYSCCGYNFCCARGYACPVSGPCVPADVVTVAFSTTITATANMISTVYASSTSWLVLTSTDYRTVTSHVPSGVSTSTSWITVTTTQFLKRAAPAPTAGRIQDEKQDAGPFLVQGRPPAGELVRRALADLGLLDRRAITSSQTVVYTSTWYRYSYTTLGSVVTSTSRTTVESTITSTVVDNASSTSTVTATTTSTVVSRAGQAQGQSGGGSSGGGSGGGGSGLSTSTIIGIAVSVSCSVLGLVFGVGFKIWKYKKGKKATNGY